MIRESNEILKSKKGSSGLMYIISLWFFISILPQMLLLTRDDFGNIQLKVALIGVFMTIVLFYLLKKQFKFNVFMILIWSYFLITQIMSNFIINPYLSSSGTNIFINIILSSLYMFVFIVIFGNFSLSGKDIIKLCVFYLLIAVYSSIYNLIINFSILGDALSTSNAYEYNLSSFFANRNTFAIFLSFSIAACFIIKDTIMKKNKYKWLINLALILLFINLILTNSRTSIVSVIIYFLFRLYLINKNRLLSFIIKLTGIIFLIVVIIEISDMSDYIVDVIIRPNSGVTHRDIVWKIGLDIFTKSNFIFGGGGTGPILYLNSLTGLRGFHNTYISLLAFGGLSLIIFNMYLILSSVNKCIKIIKYNNKIGSNFIALIVMYLASSVTENNILFYSSALNVAATTFVILLPRYYYNYLKGEKEI